MTDIHRTRDVSFMLLALIEARDALNAGERPFGCLIVDDDTGTILGKGRGTDTLFDATRHSEILAIQEACLIRGVEGQTLKGCTIYSTHEPCSMCCGAINHAKLSRVVFGSWRADLPQLFRPYDIEIRARLGDTSHPPQIVADVLNQDCVRLWEGELLEDRLRAIRSRAFETARLSLFNSTLSKIYASPIYVSETQRLCREQGIDPSVLDR